MVSFKNEDNLSLLKATDTSNKTSCYFENTFGKLLYHYQLEQLYCSLTQSTIVETIDFRKSINLKRHIAFEKAKTIVLPQVKACLKLSPITDTENLPFIQK